MKVVVRCKLHELLRLDLIWFDLVTARVSRWLECDRTMILRFRFDLLEDLGDSRCLTNPSATILGPRYRTMAKEGARERERGAEGKKLRKKRVERKDAGTLRRYFQFDLWSKPLMPAYSLAWKRIPKRYLNFPNAPRKRAKRRTILLPPLGEYFFSALTKSWQWLSIAERITSWWEIRRRCMSCLFRKQKGVESRMFLLGFASSKQMAHVRKSRLITFEF